MKTLRLSVIAIFIMALSQAAFSQGKAVPIAHMNLGGLMGGSENGKWLTPEQIFAKMSFKTEFVLASLKGVEEGGVSWGTKEPRSEDICQDFLALKFDLESDTGIAVGSAAKWNIVPRIPQEIALDNATYKKIVADFLKTKGILRPLVKITQAYRVDLEGDGTDEVLIAATNYKNGLSSSASVGDYSAIILRKTVGKTVMTYQIEGEFAGVREMRAGKPVNVKELSVGCGV